MLYKSFILFISLAIFLTGMRADDLAGVLWRNFAAKEIVYWLEHPNECYRLEEIEVKLVTSRRWLSADISNSLSPDSLGDTQAHCQNYIDTVLKARQLLGLANIYEEGGDWPEAYRLAQQASEHNPENVIALFTVMRLAERLEYDEEATRTYQALLNRQPSFKTEIKSGRWVLEGFDVNNWEIEFHDRLNITLYWRLVGDESTAVSFSNHPEWTFQQVDSRVYQIGLMDNWVGNAGLERALFSSLTQPAGLQILRYDKSIDEFELVQIDREHHQTYAVMFTKGDNKLGLGTGRYTPEPGAMLIAACQIYQLPESKGRVGIAITRTENPSIYPGAYTDALKRWSKLVVSRIAPEDVGNTFLHIDSRGADNRLYFDNCLFGQVIPPWQIVVEQ